MSEFVSFEWFKLVRRPMPRVVVILLCGLTIATFCVLSANTGEKGNLFLPRGWLAALSLSSFFAPFFWPLVGATWAGNEYGWGTIRAVLTRRPSRIEHVLAALAVLLVGVALTVLALVAAGTVAGILVALLTGHPLVTTDVWSGAFFVTLLAGTLAAWYVAAFYLLVAYAAATLARSAAVGVGVGLGATLAQYALRSIFSGLGGHWRGARASTPLTTRRCDFLLLKLTPPVSGTYLRHAGWDATGNTPPAGTPTVVSIHQPNDVKAISLSNSVQSTTDNYWHVGWDKGTTEDGSSGSCLFDYNHRCIGQLEGGDGICWGWGGQSWYRKLSASWNGGGTNETCLAHWLDPNPMKPDCSSSNPPPGTSMDGD